MKLVRFGPLGHEKPGLIDAAGQVRDLSAVIADLDGAGLAPASLAKLKAIDPASLPLVEGSPRLGACVARPGNFIAVGLNYADHAAETGAAIPKEPILFNKAPNCAVGAYDDVIIPKGSSKLDWECELAIVIGARASYIGESEVDAHIAGYCICNDVSEREFQSERGGTWMKGKSAPTFGPLGPWMVTPDDVADVHALDMWLDVNGERRQRGSTKTMIFNVRQIVAYVSHFMTLDPGDVITTGTPPGVALGMKPAPVYLKPGDVMTLGIAGLGEQRQILRAWSRASIGAE